MDFGASWTSIAIGLPSRRNPTRSGRCRAAAPVLRRPGPRRLEALFCGLRRGELARLAVDQRRLRRRRDPRGALMGSRPGTGRCENRRGPPRGPDGICRQELMAHKARTGRDGRDLVFGRTATEAFFASTIRARANKAWKQAGLQPLTPHEARHCAISYFIAARPGLEADLDLGRPWRCPPDLEPLRTPRPRRRRPRPGASRCVPDASDCGAHCGARPRQRENPRIYGGSEVPLPGFELCCEPRNPSVYRLFRTVFARWGQLGAAWNRSPCSQNAPSFAPSFGAVF